MMTQKKVVSKAKKGTQQTPVSQWHRTQTAEGWKRAQLRMRQQRKKKA